MTKEQQEVLEAIKLKIQRSGRNYVTIAETAKQANISNTRARGQLKVLVDKGHISKSKIGHRACFYLMEYVAQPVELCRTKKITKIALKKVGPQYCPARSRLTNFKQ